MIGYRLLKPVKLRRTEEVESVRAESHAPSACRKAFTSGSLESLRNDEPDASSFRNASRQRGCSVNARSDGAGGRNEHNMSDLAIEAKDQIHIDELVVQSVILSLCSPDGVADVLSLINSVGWCSRQGSPRRMAVDTARPATSGDGPERSPSDP